MQLNNHTQKASDSTSVRSIQCEKRSRPFCRVPLDSSGSDHLGHLLQQLLQASFAVPDRPRARGKDQANEGPPRPLACSTGRCAGSRGGQHDREIHPNPNLNHLHSSSSLTHRGHSAATRAPSPPTAAARRPPPPEQDQLEQQDARPHRADHGLEGCVRAPYLYRSPLFARSAL